MNIEEILYEMYRYCRENNVDEKIEIVNDDLYRLVRREYVKKRMSRHLVSEVEMSWLCNPIGPIEAYGLFVFKAKP